MRIGVICEGPSDYPAVVNFVGHALRQHGITPVFQPLYPEMDRTRPDGGWANVLLWLINNPPETRVQRYFKGGLFGGALSKEPLNSIIIQLDSDVLEDESFRNFVKKNYGYEVITAEEPARRGACVASVVALAANYNDLSDSDKKRHVVFPAVEASETWCVAVFHPQRGDYESLRGKDLVNAFMHVLEKSEGRDPNDEYANVDKNLTRRQKFCETHAGGVTRILNSCPHFSSGIEALLVTR